MPKRLRVVRLDPGSVREKSVDIYIDIEQSCLCNPRCKKKSLITILLRFSIFHFFLATIQRPVYQTSIVFCDLGFIDGKERVVFIN